jgi:hypothetical protein
MSIQCRRPLFSVAALGFLLVAAGCDNMPLRGTSGSVAVQSKNAMVAVGFSDADQRFIRDYYAKSHRKPLPPGLAKRGALPPGLAKQVRKNGALPPGLQGRALPADLESRLARLPEGYVRVVIGSDVVLQNTRTRVVVDVIKDIAVF